MKKIPTLFKREFGGRGGIVAVLPEVTPGLEWVLDGGGEATEKVDGAACAIIDGRLYKRFDAKHGKQAPTEGIACQEEPDPVTGHWPWWIPADAFSGADKWFFRAFFNTPWNMEDGTYEAVGPHFQSNPYALDDDYLERHGRIKLPDCPRDFDGIREYLRAHDNLEGVVWWKDGEPRCKIKRTDFGFKWPTDYWKEDA